MRDSACARAGISKKEEKVETGRSAAGVVRSASEAETAETNSISLRFNAFFRSPSRRSSSFIVAVVCKKGSRAEIFIPGQHLSTRWHKSRHQHQRQRQRAGRFPISVPRTRRRTSMTSLAKIGASSATKIKEGN